MNNTSDVWLNIEEVCSLTNSKKETIRRKCKSGEYKSRFELAGRNKNYQILLSSMPLKYIEKYKSYLTPTSQNEVEQSLEAYSNIFHTSIYRSKVIKLEVYLWEMCYFEHKLYLK